MLFQFSLHGGMHIVQRGALNLFAEFLPTFISLFTLIIKHINMNDLLY